MHRAISVIIALISILSRAVARRPRRAAGAATTRPDGDGAPRAARSREGRRSPARRGTVVVIAAPRGGAPRGGASGKRRLSAARGQGLVEAALWIPVAVIVVYLGVSMLLYAYDRAMVGALQQRVLINAGQGGGETSNLDHRLAAAARIAHVDTSHLWVRISTPGDQGDWHLLSEDGTPAQDSWRYAAAALPGEDIDVQLHYSYTIRAPFLGVHDVGIETGGTAASLSYQPAGADQ